MELVQKIRITEGLSPTLSQWDRRIKKSARTASRHHASYGNESQIEKPSTVTKKNISQERRDLSFINQNDAHLPQMHIQPT
jgi:hypothetical protein